MARAKLLCWCYVAMHVSHGIIYVPVLFDLRMVSPLKAVHRTVRELSWGNRFRIEYSKCHTVRSLGRVLRNNYYFPTSPFPLLRCRRYWRTKSWMSQHRRELRSLMTRSPFNPPGSNFLSTTPGWWTDPDSVTIILSSLKFIEGQTSFQR